MMDDARLSEIERMVGDWSLSSGIIRNACEDLIEEVRRLRGRIAEVEEAIQEAASGICVRCCKCHSVFVFTKDVYIVEYWDKLCLNWVHGIRTLRLKRL